MCLCRTAGLFLNFRLLHFSIQQFYQILQGYICLFLTHPSQDSGISVKDWTIMNYGYLNSRAYQHPINILLIYLRNNRHEWPSLLKIFFGGKHANMNQGFFLYFVFPILLQNRYFYLLWLVWNWEQSRSSFMLAWLMLL